MVRWCIDAGVAWDCEQTARSGAPLRGKQSTVQSERDSHCIRMKLQDDKSLGWHRAKTDLKFTITVLMADEH